MNTGVAGKGLPGHSAFRHHDPADRASFPGSQRVDSQGRRPGLRLTWGPVRRPVRSGCDTEAKPEEQSLVHQSLPLLREPPRLRPSMPGETGRNEFYGPALELRSSPFQGMKITERFEPRRGGGLQHLQPSAFPQSRHRCSRQRQPDRESAIFGIITNTFTQPDGTTSARQIQVAMKLNF